ncbi:LRR receptor-like serine/threonine-protein kinase ERL2, partial [Amborella trichopoda]|uniref:LRR receptor-like serine/threonine-protein kinase ERL2 n=1 Tax=Amborella trichopoda TaxID=13333 RepID=UPI0009BD445D
MILNLSNNHLTGTLPTSLGDLRQILVLDLSQNMLKGKIPRELGRLHFLGLFSVTDNDLEGSVPCGFIVGFCGVIDLIVLNISNNHPNGTIPDSFAELSQIEVLDLSHNMLKGRIPSDLGKECSENPKLCGYPRKKCSQLQQEDKENEEKISRWVGDKPVLYACIALGFIVGFSGVLWFLFLSKKW